MNHRLLSFSFIVLLLSVLYSCKTDNKMGSSVPQKQYVYLTFDDGPLDGSQNIDSIILAEKIKISVFLIGSEVDGDRDMETYFKYYEENPYIDEYNHSFTHGNDQYTLFYSNPHKATEDFLKNQEFLKIQYKIIRMPACNTWRFNNRKQDDCEINAVATADSLAARGFKVYGWDVEWQHHEEDGTPVQSVDEMYKQIMDLLNTNKTFTKNNIVILLHDEMFQRRWEETDLKQLIDRLRKDKNIVFEQMRFYPQD
ncbi:polysaccharide deacetylase [Paludibacter propionicigenes WB4]|uniref:Polysaccharide deacetylase n=1 Tax=Paludibacter propionicigenes (strain DSM 17365 / JCM 13257 / WB4) TaxID=694427 RepID=E4T5R6_PALPW|nr:polysaccharide deacetylase family protein [Paludibacter propionicigenes]ADQ80060.1 polysaccharide deacetylase [Paludibacter propionicigenes WB4]